MVRQRKESFTDLKSVTRQLTEGLVERARIINLYGYEPHAKQVMFHKADKLGRQYIGGNRSGKTVGGIVEDLWWLLGRHPYIKTPVPPIRGRIVTTNIADGLNGIIIPEIARWLPVSELRGGSWDSAYETQDRILHFQNGSFVEFKTYEQDKEKHAGTSRHFVHFDEEPPKHLFTENMARLVDTSGRWWITMTPVEGMTWTGEEIFEAVNTGKRDDVDVIQVDMTENPYLPVAAREAFLSNLDEDERKARKSGTYVPKGGLVYRKYRPELHLVDSFIPPKDWFQYGGYDHGFNNPTGYLWAAIAPPEQDIFPSGSIIIWDEYYEREQTIDQVAAELRRRNNLPMRRQPDIQIADPAIRQRTAVSGNSIQREYALRGLSFVLGNNDVKIGVNKVNQYLFYEEETSWLPRLYLTRNCVELQREIKKLR
jgi:phage terminase large subunit-like protein